MTYSETVATWKTHPYTSHDKRSWTVHHRVLLKKYDSGLVDVIVERKLPDAGQTSWAEVEAYEIRPHGVEHVEYLGGVMEE